MKPVIVYMTHSFPGFTDVYVSEEMEALRTRGATVLHYSGYRTKGWERGVDPFNHVRETTYLRPFQIRLLLKAFITCFTGRRKLGNIYKRIFVQGNEGVFRRIKALLHTWLGVYLYLLLEGKNVMHIHANHGYFASWAAMIASKLLSIPFSVTLHHSDLIIDRVYIDLKTSSCSLCFTISDFNKKFLLDHYPATNPQKVIVNRMGVNTSNDEHESIKRRPTQKETIILSIGRLAPVKNYEFLLKGCFQLKQKGLKFLCIIIGEGKERKKLEGIIKELQLSQQVKIMGTIDHTYVQKFYRMADLFVLTSKSEGIPLVLMEAMFYGTIVLAPSVTGIPEIISDGKTGFLYESGNMDEFVEKMMFIQQKLNSSSEIIVRAREKILMEYNRHSNTNNFADIILKSLPA
jgi:glycosyltransferase involved in cell wall biosynthesis